MVHFQWFSIIQMLFDLICYAFFQCLFSTKNPHKLGQFSFQVAIIGNFQQVFLNICHQHDFLRIENLIKMFHETVHHDENWLMRLKLLPKPQKNRDLSLFFNGVKHIRSMNRRYLPKLLRHMLDGCHGQGIWQWLQHWLLCNKNYDLHLQFLK